tara:strand:- start:20819 stop:21817 length:999 start_codon:yes stop_codon:yes gene_type:complete
MSVDIVSGVLDAVRLTGAIFFDVEAHGVWVSEAPNTRVLTPFVFPNAKHLIEYHIVTEGTIWAQVVDAEAEPVRLEAGCVILFPHGNAHTLSTQPGMRAPSNLALFEHREGQTLPYRVVATASNSAQRVRLVCGFLASDMLPFNPLIQALPHCIHIAGAYTSENGWLKTLIEAIVRESADNRVGGGSILSKLSELIFIEVIRRYVESRGSMQTGWFEALADPIAGEAIRRFHAEPSRAWSLEVLAREVGTSRTILVQRFKHTMAVPPMTYLARWRMQVAAGLLAGGSFRLARIAEEVGYDSEAAFSRAFKRFTGTSPSKWRCLNQVYHELPD